MQRFAVLFVAVAVLVTAHPAAASTSADERNAEQLLFQKIDGRRSSLGKDALIEHDFMRTQAEKHSDAMAGRNLLGHFGFTARIRAIRANDSGIANSGDGWICENVAYARGYSSMQQAIGVIFQGWLNSAPHRRCMLDQEGHKTQSAAVGITHSGSTWWATYIGAHDTSP